MSFYMKQDLDFVAAKLYNEIQQKFPHRIGIFQFILFYIILVFTITFKL